MTEEQHIKEMEKHLKAIDKHLKATNLCIYLTPNCINIMNGVSHNDRGIPQHQNVVHQVYVKKWDGGDW